jgi:hypothetical protein
MICEGSGTGSGRSTTAWTALKIAAVDPMPSASVMSATAVRPGVLLSWRTAKVTSCPSSFRYSVRRMSLSLPRPIARQVAFTRSMSPKRRMAASRASRALIPRASSSRARIST